MEAKQMRIGVGKIGKSTLFNEKMWSAHGGDIDAPTMITLLAKYNPEHKFYIIGKSDFGRLKPHERARVNPHGNIIDPWMDYDKNTDHISFLLNWFDRNQIKLDTAVLYSGPSGNANIPDKIKTVKGDEIAKVLYCFAHYAGPVINYLNLSGLKYFTLVPDPRYHPFKARDCYNIAKFGLSQYDSTDMKVKHILNYEDQRYEYTKVPTYYSGIETLFLTTRKRLPIMELEKTIPMTVILNEGGNGGLWRGPLMKEYILNKIQDVEVFGKWSDEWMKDPRMKGPMHINLLEEKLKATKATFIIPIEQGWVTAKFWEMAHFGVLPFMHPYYDEQKHIKCHEILRTKSPSDFVEKYEAVMNDPKLYHEVLSNLDSLLDEKYYSGLHINNVVMKTVYRIAGADPSTYVMTKERMDEIDSQLKSNPAPVIVEEPKKPETKKVECENSLASFFD